MRKSWCFTSQWEAPGNYESLHCLLLTTEEASLIKVQKSTDLLQAHNSVYLEDSLWTHLFNKAKLIGLTPGPTISSSHSFWPGLECQAWIPSLKLTSRPIRRQMIIQIIVKKLSNTQTHLSWQVGTKASRVFYWMSKMLNFIYWWLVNSGIINSNCGQ